MWKEEQMSQHFGSWFSGERFLDLKVGCRFVVYLCPRACVCGGGGWGCQVLWNLVTRYGDLLQGYLYSSNCKLFSAIGF